VPRGVIGIERKPLLGPICKDLNQFTAREQRIETEFEGLRDAMPGRAGGEFGGEIVDDEPPADLDLDYLKARAARAGEGVLICAPDDPVAADIVEEEKAGPERRLTDLGVPHEEAAGERPEPASSAVRQLDAVFFVGEKHEHVAIARVEGRVVLGDSHPFAELTRHAPLPRDAVAKFLNEGVDYFGIIDASIVGAVDGPELVDTAVLVRGEEDADVFGRLGSRFARSVGRACYRTVARDKSRSRNFWKSVLVDK